MDLLIQITSKHKLNIRGYFLKVMSEKSINDNISYKPSTPIGEIKFLCFPKVMAFLSNLIKKRSKFLS